MGLWRRDPKYITGFVLTLHAPIILQNGSSYNLALRPESGFDMPA